MTDTARSRSARPRTALAGSCGRPSAAGGASSCGATFPRTGSLIGAVLCFALFSWYPMVREIIMSFQKTHLGVTTWAGWTNYIRIFHDPEFRTAVANTLEFTGLAPVSSA